MKHGGHYLLDREAAEIQEREPLSLPCFASVSIVSSHVYLSSTFPPVPDISLALTISLPIVVNPGPALVYACLWPCRRLFFYLNIYPLLAVKDPGDNSILNLMYEFQNNMLEGGQY